VNPIKAAALLGADLTCLLTPFAALVGLSCKLLKEILKDASTHPHRAFLIFNFDAPPGLHIGEALDL
jgi:hypothetical protein